MADDGGPKEEPLMCASMLGSLGLFGNHLLQLVACMALAESQGLRLAVPETWNRRFGCLFCGGIDGDDDRDDSGDDPLCAPLHARWHAMPDHQAWALPVVSDRVVLSHPGFRAWIATREPYISLAAAATSRRSGGSGSGRSNGGSAGAGSARLSGTQLRRLFPQATVAHLEGGASSTLAGRGLWGWFQWPTGRLAPCAARLLLLAGDRAPLRLRPRLARALDAAMDALAAAHTKGARRRTSRRLVALHVRRGDVAATLSASSSSAGGAGDRAPVVLRTEPPFEVEAGESWDDQGQCWRTPVEWLRPALEAAVAGLMAAAAAAAAAEGGAVRGDEGEEEPPPLVVLCTDDPDLARDPDAVWPGAVTWTRPGWAAEEEDAGGLAATLEGARAALAACRRRRRPEGRDDDDKDDDGDGNDADLHMLLDWRIMQRADALLASNSTFSFTAALLRSPPPSALASVPAASASVPPSASASLAASSSDRRPIFLRPCPQAGGFVAFEPWDSLPLLPSRPNLPANHGASQQQQQR